MEKKEIAARLAAAFVMAAAGIAVGFCSGNVTAFVPGLEGHRGEEETDPAAQPEPPMTSDKEAETETDDGKIFAEEEEATDIPEKEEENSGRVNSVVYLNLAYLYPDGTSLDLSGGNKSKGLNSCAGLVYQKIVEKDAEWLSNIYKYIQMKPEEAASALGLDQARIMGKYNPEAQKQQPDDSATWIVPEWSNIKLIFLDGDNNQISGYSNGKEILSLASVYTYYKDWKNQEEFNSYVDHLWENSHSFHVMVSEVYYCEGCLNKEAADLSAPSEDTADSLVSSEETIVSASKEELDETGEESLPTSESTANLVGQSEEPVTKPESGIGPGYEKDVMETLADEDGHSSVSEGETQADASIETPACPGHLDLTVTATILGLDGKRNLFSAYAAGGNKKNNTEIWQGWGEKQRLYVRYLSQQDWYEYYGVTVTSISANRPLSEGEISKHMESLTEDISQERKELVRFALGSVGRVPYYYGGKADAAGYENNRFESIVPPDEKGRMLKGLDCSGWINWVYWSSLGKRLPFEGTDGLSSLGTGIDREELRTGDILVRTGDHSHAAIFFKWTEDGKMECIHETGGTDNNVTVGVLEEEWSSYRRLLD